MPLARPKMPCVGSIPNLAEKRPEKRFLFLCARIFFESRVEGKRGPAANPGKSSEDQPPLPVAIPNFRREPSTPARLPSSLHAAFPWTARNHPAIA